MARRYGTSGDESYYSELYENAVYIQDGVTGDYGRDKRDSGAPILRNVKTGERVFLRRMGLNPKERGAYLRRVLEPPHVEGLLWPADLIRLDDKANKICNLFVDHEYRPVGTPFELRPGGYAVAMPVFNADLMPGDMKFNQIKPLRWTEPPIQSIAVRLAMILDQLNSAGYNYNDLHPSRLIFPPSGRVLLDYSHLILPREAQSDSISSPRNRQDYKNNQNYNQNLRDIQDLRDFQWSDKNWVEKYPLDFADPSLIQGLIPAPDRQSQNYSFAALLFYLFFNRGPYDGGLFAGYPDDTPYNHETRLKYILRLPIFIFDPDDDSNAPGFFAEDDEIITLWSECPEVLKSLFLKALPRVRAERREKNIARPEPLEWLAAFKSLGWK